MERLTEKRDGKNVIPLRNAITGIDVPYWKISKANDLEAFLYGAAADKLAAYEDGDRKAVWQWKNSSPSCAASTPS